MMKQEQDMAYQQSLMADRAKVRHACNRLVFYSISATQLL